MGSADHAQLAWNNQTATQSQARTEQVAPGYEAIAQAMAELLQRLPELGLGHDDQQDVVEQATVVLAEVVTPEPDRTKVRRALNFVRGVLTTLGIKGLAGAGEATQDSAKQWISKAIEVLQLPPM
jgi:hypothetical protein